MEDRLPACPQPLASRIKDARLEARLPSQTRREAGSPAAESGKMPNLRERRSSSIVSKRLSARIMRRRNTKFVSARAAETSTPGTCAPRSKKFEYSALQLIDDFEAHLAGGAGDDAEGGFVVARVQVLGFRFHDVHDLFARNLADFGFVWLFGTGSDIRRLF
jgi:hypothetical protein